MKSFLVILLVGLSPLAFAGETLVYTGEGFDKTGKTKMFDYKKFKSVDGKKVSERAIYTDLSGDILTEEKVESRDGKLVRYDMDQKQLNQKAWIEVTDKKVTFNLKKFRKKNYPITVDRPDNFIVGLEIVPTIIKNWDVFMKGKDMTVQLGVWHRQEAIGFKLSRDKSDDKNLVVKMAPTSFLIRAVVDPLYFIFDKKTKLLTSYKGRLTPKEKQGRSYGSVDGVVKYQQVKATENK